MQNLIMVAMIILFAILVVVMIKKDQKKSRSEKKRAYRPEKEEGMALLAGRLHKEETD